MPTIDSRLAAVENQLRFQRTIIAGLLIALVALVGYGASEGIPDVIRARKFVVVSEEGREVVVIKSWKYGGWFQIKSSDGIKSTHLLSHDGKGLGRLDIKNKEGKNIFFVGADVVGNGAVSLNNKEGKGIITLGFTVTDNGHLVVKSREGKGKVMIQGGSDDGGSLIIYNKTGEEVVQVYADDYGMGYVGVFDRKGEGRVLKPR